MTMMTNMLKITVAWLIALLSQPVVAQGWSSSLDYSSDGHTYVLARYSVKAMGLVYKDWKSLTWDVGLTGGQDLAENTAAGGLSVMLKLTGSSGFYVGVCGNLLTKESVKGIVPQGSLVFGFASKT